MDREKKKFQNEYKKKYRKRSRSVWLVYVRRAVRKLKRNRTLVLMAGAGLLAVCSVALVIWALVKGLSGQGEEQIETVEQVQGESYEPEEPLLENAYPEINELVQTYFTALQEGDQETLMLLRDRTEDKELLRMQENSGHIESYSNIVCYTKAGLEADSYTIFACYDVTFQGMETALPGITPLYAYKDSDGAYRLHDLSQEDERSAHAAGVAAQEDVAALYSQVSELYQQRLSEDEALAAYVNAYTGEMMAAVGEALEEQPESQAESQSEEQPEAEGGTEESGQSAAGSSQTGSTGTGSTGTGSTGTGSSSQVPNSGTFTVSESVNVRRSASETSEKLGTCYPGEELEILMKQADGWTRVSYKGQTGYVKSDVLK